jgi:hypothetical protein
MVMAFGVEPLEQRAILRGPIAGQQRNRARSWWSGSAGRCERS